jgi:hypothetical protein
MASAEHTIDAGALTAEHRATLVLTLERPWRHRLRFAVGSWVVRLGLRVMGFASAAVELRTEGVDAGPAEDSTGRRQ